MLVGLLAGKNINSVVPTSEFCHFTGSKRKHGFSLQVVMEKKKKRYIPLSVKKDRFFIISQNLVKLLLPTMKLSFPRVPIYPWWIHDFELQGSCGD